MKKALHYLTIYFVSFSTITFAQNSFTATIQSKNYTEPFQVCKDEPVVLEAFPKSDTLTYDWYKNGQLIISGASNQLALNEGGLYNVVINSSIEKAFSENIYIQSCTVIIPEGSKTPPWKGTLSAFPVINSVNPVICGSNTTAVLTVTPNNASYTYQWYYNDGVNSNYSIIAGATSNTHTTTILGNYIVSLNDGISAVSSAAFKVSDKPIGILTDMAGNLFFDVLATAGAAQLKVKLFGGAPYNFYISNGTSSNYYSSLTDEYILNLNVAQNRQFSFSSISNTCGSGTVSGANRIIIDPITNVTLPTPNTLNVCAGGTIDIPYTTVGTWLPDRQVQISLVSATNTNSTVTTLGSFSQNPIPFTIPSFLSIGGTYKIRIRPTYPAINSVVSTYTLTVNSTGCTPTATIVGNNTGCSSVYLNAQPNSNSYSYQWFKDGVAIANANNSYIYASQSGNYKVAISQSSINYSSTSLELPVTIAGVTAKISSVNPVICGSNTSAVLNANPSGPGYSYQWYTYNTSNGQTTAIPNATSASYSTTTIGSYILKVSNGDCENFSGSFRVTNTSQAILSDLDDNTNGTITTVGGTAQLKISLYGGGPYSFTYYDGSVNKVIVSNTSPYFLTVSPDQNRLYYLNSVISQDCGSGITSGNVRVVVDGNTSLTLPNPASLNVCAGSTISIPYTTIGTWQNNRNLNVQLYDSNGAYISNSYISGFSTNPIEYTLPSNLPINSSYRVNVSSSLPATTNSIFSNYLLTVNSVGCTPTAVIRGQNTHCDLVFLDAFLNNGSVNIYTWYRDNTLISSSSTSYFLATQSGNYKVNITNSLTGYNSTSAERLISIIGPGKPVVTTSNTILCGSNLSVALTSNITSGTIQWFLGNQPIIGANNAIYQAKQIGTYRVLLSSGTCDVYSDNIEVSDKPSLIITNTNNTNDPIDIGIGGTATIKVTFTGSGPWNFDLVSEGISTKSYVANASPYFIDVNPSQSQRYYIYNLMNSCGFKSLGNGSQVVNVLPNPSFTLPAPAISTVCLDGFLEIPYNITGNWSSNRKFLVYLTNANGSSSKLTIEDKLNTGKLVLEIKNLTQQTGIHSIVLEGLSPVTDRVYSTYTINVISNTTNCVIPPTAAIKGNFNSCSNSTDISTYNYGSGYTYLWFKDGVLAPNQFNSYTYYPNQSGNYNVVVSNSTTSFTSTSPSALVTLGGISTLINQNASSLCSNGTSLTYSSSNSNPALTYQWFYSSNGNGFAPINGAISNSYTTTLPGAYYIIIKNGDCEVKSNIKYTCPITINFNSKTVCQNSNITVPFTFNFFSQDKQFRLQLIDATTNNIINPNLKTLNFGETSSFNFDLPNTVLAGSYKFRVITTDLSYISDLSTDILIVSNSIAGAAPIISSNVSTITGSTSINLTSAGCNGSLVWNQGNSQSINDNYYTYISKTTTFFAFCREVEGCISPSSSKTITYDCSDILEPNNNAPTATIIPTNTYTSPIICFDGNNDSDWFSWNYNGKIYYIMSKIYGAYSSIGSYQFKLTQSGSTLVVETLPISPGQYLDTYLMLFDSDAITTISTNDNGNNNGFSKITYTLPNPCPNVQTLVSPTNDILVGQTITIKGISIIATNVVNNTAIVDYNGQNSVLLNPGFETKTSSGGTFKAQVKGCNE